MMHLEVILNHTFKRKGLKNHVEEVLFDHQIRLYKNNINLQRKIKNGHNAIEVQIR